MIVSSYQIAVDDGLYTGGWVVWATLLALIWLYGCKIEQQVEWQFVAMKAASWIGSQKGEISIPDHLDSVSVHQETFELISSVL